MKSKSFDLKKSPGDSGKHNKTYDFVGYYKTIETSKLSGKRVSGENAIKENTSEFEAKDDTPKRGRPLKKKKSKNEPVDISLINIDGQSLLPATGRSSPVERSQQTSTPYSTRKGEGKAPKVKSIMKNSTIADDTMDSSNLESSTLKSKKRNKSVSFMLDDNEEVVIKKSKSEDSLQPDKIQAAKTKSKHMKCDMKKLKKYKKQLQAMQAEKENNNMATVDTSPTGDDLTRKPKKKSHKTKSQTEGTETTDDTKMAADQTSNQKEEVSTKRSKKKLDKTKTQLDTVDSETQVEREKKKKSKKVKKPKETDDSSPPTETENNNNETEYKVKKLRKKKRQAKTTAPETTENEGEPAKKSRKKEMKPEIVEHLQNLSIGDNPHTLSNLLDEMTVVDKDKKKKNKVRRKNKKSPAASNSETTDLEKIEEGKEKIKWKKRKWNKDKKGEAEDRFTTTIIVDNLPLAMMMEYKKVLMEHFGKFGLVQRIGVAELYPEDSKPVFSTTVRFYSEGAAEKALEEPEPTISGAPVLVSACLPPVQTTLVGRSYAELSEQAVSSVFSAAGRLRSIRVMVKGRKAMATAFIEFDGPEAVERAIKMAADVRIGGKRIHVSRYEVRGARRPKPAKNTDSDNEGDSEDSND